MSEADRRPSRGCCTTHAAVFDKVVTRDPQRVARAIVFLPERANWDGDDTAAFVFAITAMRVAP